MNKKLTVKAPVPKLELECCKICLVRPCCSIGDLSDCPDAWAEIMKVGSFVYWPITLENTTAGSLREDGYSEEDVDYILKVDKIISDIRKHKLTIRPATILDKNVAKFVVTEY